MSNKRIGVVITLTAVLVASGCSTKRYVSKEVGAVNQKVETLSESVERNQERIGRNADEISRHGGEIQRVDAKADEAAQEAASSASREAASEVVEDRPGSDIADERRGGARGAVKSGKK